MALIKPRTRGKQLVRHRTRLDHETNETLYAYAQFIGEPTEYVLNQVIDTVLAKDRDFLQWRAEHPDSFVPRNLGTRHNRRPAHAPVRALSDTDDLKSHRVCPEIPRPWFAPSSTPDCCWR